MRRCTFFRFLHRLGRRLGSGPFGNLFRQPLGHILEAYDPSEIPVVAELIHGGPAEIVRRFELEHQPGYADACHLCYSARNALRERFPEVLAPNQMYGVFS